MKLVNVKLESGICIINENFSLQSEQNDTIIIWDKPEIPTVYSSPLILFDALRLALPAINLWVFDDIRSEDKLLYELLKPRNTVLLNFYESKDDDFKRSPNFVKTISEEDIIKLKEVYLLMINHHQSQNELRKTSQWKATEWVFALNHYLQSCSSNGLEESILSIITAFEALLVTGHEQVSYRASLNASLLYSEDADTRARTFNLIKEMYNLRSKVVHGDLQGFIKSITKPDIYDKYFELKSVLSAILLKTQNYDAKEINECLTNAIFNCPKILNKN